MEIKKNTIMHKYKLSLIVFLIGIASFIMATLFKILHLAGAVFLLSFAMITLVIAIFIFIIQLLRKP
jgi:hypothetical protein